MGLNPLRDRLCVLQISDEKQNAYLVQFTFANYLAPNLKQLLNDASRCKIFHYGRFDIAMIKQYLQLDLTNIFCTKLASKLVRTYTDAHSLKELCREILGITLSKQQQSSNWGKESLSIEQQEYAAKDVIYLHEIRQELIVRLKQYNRFEIAQRTFEFLPCRANLDLLGWGESDIFSH